MRKLKSFWALLCLLLVSTNVSLSQTVGGVWGSLKWDYYSSTGKLVLTGTGSTADSGVLPADLKPYRASVKTIEIGSGVTAIGYNAFYDFTSLNSVSIPSTVTSIGSYAFQNCTSLKSISLPSAVKTIGNYAFLNSGLTSFTVPTSCTSIGEGALASNAITSFYSNSTSFSPKNSNAMLVSSAGALIAGSVNTVSLDLSGTGVKTIAAYAYHYNSKLKIIYNAAVTAVGNYAFYNASGINSLAFTGGACTFGSNAFSSSIKSSCIASCWNATTVTNLKAFVTNTFAQKCGDNMSWMMESNGTSIQFWGSGTMTSAPWSSINSKITSIYMPSGATSIAANAFKGCTNLTYFTGTWTDITSVGAGAFSGCTSITALPPFVSSSTTALTTIGNSAFDGCTKLTSFDLSVYTKLTTLGTGVFRNCTGLKSAKFTGNVTSIPKAFCKNCTSLASFTPYLNLASVGDSAFAYTSISNFYFDQLTLLKTIGREAFSGAKFTTVTNLPSSLTTIGLYAFENNTSLTSFSVPSGVTSIGGAPLYGCSSLTSINGGSTTYSVSGNGIYKGNVLIQGCKNTVLKSTTTELASLAFSGHNITSITFPATLTTIAQDALSWPVISNIIDNRTDASKVSLTTSHFSSATKSSCKVQVNSADIKTKYTAAGFAAANVMVTSCGTNATWSFNPATGELSIYGSGDITSCSQGNYPWNAVMSQIKKLGISSSITSIPDYAFFNASNMASTDMATSDKVKSIGAYAFNGTALTAISLPTVLTTIGNYAFANTKLASPTIPASVTSIGNGILASAPLTTITVTAGNGYYKAENGALLTISGKTLYALAKGSDIPATVTKISGYALSNGVTTVTIPASVTAYDGYWASGASAITKLTVLSTTKPSAIGDLSKTACEIHVGSPVQTTAKSIYSNWKTSLGFSKVVYDYCGTNLTWSVASNKLTITKVNETGSTGAMWNFTSSATAATLPWYSSKGTITNVEIGSGVTTVGDYAFQNCTAITSVTIPNTVTMIGAGAFSGATKLASVTLPSALTSIGENAFQSTVIKSLSIPATVTVIGAFGANSIQTIKVDPANATFTSQDKSGNELNMLLTKDGKSLFLCPATTDNVTLPSTLTEVKAGAFNGAVGKLTIPAKVTTMSAWPTSASSIHAANVPTTAATVPSSLKSVKVYASTAAVQTKYKGLGFTNVVVGTSCGSNASYFFENGVLTIVGSGEVTSAPWLTDANIGAAKIKRVVVESGVTGITYKYSFKDCVNLTSVKFPDGFQQLYGGAFDGCSNLKSLVVPASFTTMSGSNGLENSGIENISVRPCDGTNYVKSVDANGNELNAIIYISSNKLKFAVDPSIPASAAAVDYHCIKTQSVTDFNIPAKVTTIADGAFANLTIKNIYSASTATIPAKAFSGTDMTKAKVYVASDAIKAKFVAAGFTEANIKVATGQCGADMYYYVNGKKLIIFGGGDMYESGLTWAGGATAANAFTSIQFVGNAINTIGKNAFSACTAVKGEIVIPASVTKIGAGAFGSTLITSVVANGQKPASMAATGFTADVYAKASLVVPNDSRDSYLEATGWENFGGVQTNEEVANPYDLNKDGRVNGTDVNFLKGKF